MAENYFDQFDDDTQTTNYFDQFDDDSETSRFSSLKRPDYSSVRSGAVDFIESAVGAGDELDAVIRLMSGAAQTWDEAITASRGELRAFQEENPTASNILSVAGFASGLFVPGAGVAKIAQSGSKLSRAAKVSGIGAAEGAVYGFLAGEGEDRATSAVMGAGLGGVLGGVAGGLLTKSADEIKEATKKIDAETWAGKGSHIGGAEGFVNVGRAKEGRKVGKDFDTSLAGRAARDITDDAPITAHPKAPSDIRGNVFLTTKEWIAKNVGQRAAKLAEDAETLARHDQREIEEIFDTTLKLSADVFENNRALKSIALRMNKSIKKDRRTTWSDLNAAAKTAQEKQAVQLLQEQMAVLSGLDFVKVSKGDYIPAKALEAIKGSKKGKVVGNPDQYHNPLLAVKEMAEDISVARSLIARFNVDINKIRQPKIGKGESRLDVVIEAIEKQAKREGASEDVAANLANGLRSQFIASKVGGNVAGAVLRRTVSGTLLGNPLNALLNVAEGITAPIYQNGVKAWAQTIPKGILSTFNQTFGIRNPNWLSNRQIGLDKEFMGELANAGEKAFRESAEGQRFVWNKGVVRGLDTLSKGLYKLSGVSTVNRMGQEMLTNSAIRRGIDLAKKGKLDKLRKHDGMRGLTESEFQATVNALKNEQYSNPWVLNFAGSSLNKWQPVSASAMPKAFHDNPNGRMAYSMLSYMNKQMNSIRTDIGLNISKAQRLGLNTKEGAEAARTAMLNSAKYAALFGVFAGIWDDGRKTLDLSKNKELEDLLTPEGISKALLNQLASNMSSGIVNIRSEEYGGKPVELRPAPISAAAGVLSGVAQTSERLFTGEDEPLTPLLRAGQTYVPGVANIDRVLRAATGERLFEQLGLLD
jgi:hypothetical protein